jgi:hypothetical protein
MSHRGTTVLLWILSVMIMIGAAAWQRMTGPTHPRRGTAIVEGQTLQWRLLRSGTSGEPFVISIPAVNGMQGVVRYRRFPTNEPLVTLPMQRHGETFEATLPSQPPAGKLEYSVALTTLGGEISITGDEPVVMRFKGDVPAGVLIPHIAMMFFAMMIGVRAALAALVGRPESKRHAWVALAGITLGGLVLGPIVQKYAFGAYWTGWPFGGDLTDNKTAAMWLAWLVAVIVLARLPVERRAARATVVVAALVMIAVYLVPHSLRGSQLAYNQLDAGTSADDAVTTGH